MPILTIMSIFLQCPNSLNNPVSPTTIVPNPGFQNGIPSGWQQFGGVTMGVSSDKTYAVASGRGQNYAGPSWDISSSLSTGNHYK